MPHSTVHSVLAFAIWEICGEKAGFARNGHVANLTTIKARRISLPHSLFTILTFSPSPALHILILLLLIGLLKFQKHGRLRQRLDQGEQRCY